MAATIIVIAVFGGVIGSFLNVVIHRLPRGESLVRPGSRCPECEAPISPFDNVPVLSWVVLRGRCRRCSKAISPRYPLVELVTAAAFAGVALTRGVDEDLVTFLPFAAALVAIAGIDLDHRIIPNRIIVPLAVWAVVTAAVLRTGELPELLIAGAAAFTALLLAALAYPAGMGMGDVKLAGVMGLYLGTAVAPALLIAFAAGSVVGIAIIAHQGAGARKKGVPFGPFLAFGALAGILAGPELVDLYVDNFLNG